MSSSSLAMFAGELDAPTREVAEETSEGVHGLGEMPAEKTEHDGGELDADVLPPLATVLGDDVKETCIVTVDEEKLAAGRHEQWLKSQALVPPPTTSAPNGAGDAVEPPAKTRRIINLPPAPMPKAASHVVSYDPNSAEHRLGMQIAKAAAAQRQNALDFEAMKEKEKELKAEQLKNQEQMRDRERRGPALYRWRCDVVNYLVLDMSRKINVQTVRAVGKRTLK